MADILIKGMEMPKAQFQKSSTLYHVEGTIFVYPDGKARAELSVDYKERKSYPLVPVPPHGRLGDLDSLALLVLNWISTQEKAYPHEDSNALAWRLGAKAMANQIYRDVKAYPTIILAEEGE